MFFFCPECGFADCYDETVNAIGDESYHHPAMTMQSKISTDSAGLNRTKWSPIKQAKQNTKNKNKRQRLLKDVGE